MRTIARLLLGFIVGVVVCACASSTASAAPQFFDDSGFGLDTFTTSTSTMEAGAHPDVTVSFRVRMRQLVEDGIYFGFGALRRVEVDMPMGLAGDPTGIPTCRRELFYQIFDAFGCPANTRVGIADVWATDLGLWPAEDRAIFNLERGPDEPVLLGVKVGYNLYGFIRIKVRPDGGLTAISDELPFSHSVLGTEMTLWGVPEDHNRTGGPRLPFMMGPTECATRPTTTLRVYSYEGSSDTATHTLDDQPHSCETVPFDPVMTATPTERAAGVPTGLDVDIDVPQNALPDARVSAHVNQVRITLPEGMKISPSSANGLDACTSAQFGYRTDSAVTCPDASKIGTVSIRTPLLDEPMTGHAYLAKQNDNPFNSLLAMYIHLQGTGQQIKLAGKVDPDPVTGRLTTTFRDNPQLPFETLSLSLKSGARAPLVNPPTCGTYRSETSIAAWTEKVVSASTPMTIDRGCVPIGFRPSFRAGSISPVGGRSSTFALDFGRGDHDQELRDITVDMPEGLTGKIADATLCPGALAAAGTCGAASQIGSVTTSAGPGSQPYWLPGKAFITESYRGAPFGLSIVVPAVAGPFDLGTVVVRAAISVDRRDASLRVAADPMPRILQGIPLQIRSVNVAIDKPGFMLNPTSCAAKSVVGRITSHQGGAADVSSRFQVGGCAGLPIRQSMSLAVGARGRTGREKRTPFTATLRQLPGMGNLRSVEVVLPKTLNGRLDVIQRDRACTIAQFEADRCPTVIGQGVATTPLLRDPLRGPAYFVYNPARRLPDIVVRLQGQVDIDLVGRVTIPRDLSLRTTFDTVPDVPVSTFQLRLASGRTNGPIGVVNNLCTREGRNGRARITLIGQNGRRVDVRQRLRINGCSRRPSGRRAARGQTRRAGVKRSAPRRTG